MRPLTLCFFLLLCAFAHAQTTMPATQVLEQAIAFHDPNGQWPTFNGSFTVTMEMPSKSARRSAIKINIPQEIFWVEASRDTLTTAYELRKDSCTIWLQGQKNPSADILKTHNLSCERATLYKNYYTYLYGLPMKLKDPGTIIAPEAVKVNFHQKNYWQIKVTYTEDVGSDVWFFYFNPNNFALEAYQFFKGDPEGQGKDTGEYILVFGLEKVETIKMLIVRAWYYNKDQVYLGTDTLSKQ